MRGIAGIRLTMLLALIGLVSFGQNVSSICSSGCNYTYPQLQAAMDSATPGTIISITPGTPATGASGSLILRCKYCVLNASNSTPITLTLPTTTGISTGDNVQVLGVCGNTTSNGWHKVHVMDFSTITLDNTAGNGVFAACGPRGQGRYGYGVVNDPQSPPITIRSSLSSSLPAGRVSINDPNLATITAAASGYPAVVAENGASGYTFQGIKFTTPIGASPQYYILQLTAYDPLAGTSAWTANNAEVMRNITMDHSVVAGLPTDNSGPYNCIGASVVNFVLSNSVVTNCRGNANDSSYESKGLLFADGAYNVTLTNNQVTASSIGSLFGGQAPLVRARHATNIVATGNWYYKPWVWRSSSGSANPTGVCLYDSNGGEYYRNTTANTYWQCNAGIWASITSSQYCINGCFGNKNQFELKNSFVSIAEGNVLQNGWQPGQFNQNGAAFLLNQVDGTDTNDYRDEPATVISGAILRYNKALSTPWFASIGSMAGNVPYFNPISFQAYDNVADNWAAEPQTLGGNSNCPKTLCGSAIQLGANAGTQNGTAMLGDVDFRHNTLVSPRAGDSWQSVNVYMGYGTDNGYTYPRIKSISVQDNLMGYLTKGFYNDAGAGALQDSIPSSWGPSRMFSRNVLVDFLTTNSVVTNVMTRSTVDGTIPCESCSVPATWSAVGFTNFNGANGGDYHLTTASTYKSRGSLGLDPGADIDVVTWSTAHAVDGALNPYLYFRAQVVSNSQTGAVINYSAYDTNSCTVSVSGKWDYSSPLFTSTDTGGDPARSVMVTNLTAGNRYYWRLTCTGYSRSGVFWTRP